MLMCFQLKDTLEKIFRCWDRDNNKKMIDLPIHTEAAKSVALYAGNYLLGLDLVSRSNKRLDMLIGVAIKRLLGEETPFPIYTEEADEPEERIKEATFWWVDPIDGTTKFNRGDKNYSISIGLVHNGTPKIGAVYQPEHGRLFYAWEGSGAHLEQVAAKSTDKTEV